MNETPQFAGLCTGFGQADTHSLEIDAPGGQRRPNPHPNAGQPYGTVTLSEILGMVRKPASVDKLTARWVIPSSYVGADARSHRAQRERGQFWMLPLDVDTGNLPVDEVNKAIIAVCGASQRAIYATNPRLKTTVNGGLWSHWRSRLPGPTIQTRCRPSTTC